MLFLFIKLVLINMEVGTRHFFQTESIGDELIVQSKYPRFSKFVAAKKQLDPENIFSSEWTDEIVFGKEAAKGEDQGCALEGLCICSHARPALQPGERIFLPARPCL
jgi:hypothetical protein